MSGVVLETLSLRKLLLLVAISTVLHVICFLIGGLISPSPNASESILMTKCLVDDSTSDWQFIRPKSDKSCKKIVPDGDLVNFFPDGYQAEQLVFIAQFPHPREGVNLTMTRWFQQVLAVLLLDLKRQDTQATTATDITFDLRLGYRDRGDPPSVWHEIAHSIEKRPLNCVPGPEAIKHIDSPGDEGFYYDCDVMPLFSLASCHHEEYLINLRIPTFTSVPTNKDIGMIEDIWIVEMHQNGGFTKVWFALKTVIFPVTLLALVFFSSRVNNLDRAPTVLEKTIFVLGVGMSFLNFPVEWLSLIINVPFWLLLSDLRQGLFYAILVCFWLIFTCEHMAISSHQHENGSSYESMRPNYWPRLLLIGGCCSALTIFDLAERGVQIRNPFYSIWSHPVAAGLGLASIVVGAICASIYFAYLTYVVVRAFVYILGKRKSLVYLPDSQRKFYTTIIYRFTVLLSYTLLCAALTVAFFIFSQVTEDQWTWGDSSINYGSAFITGVYGMWNMYVISVLCMYAPSHKVVRPYGSQTNENTISEGEVEYSASGDTVRLVVNKSSGNRCTNGQSGDTTTGLAFLQKVAFE